MVLSRFWYLVLTGAAVFAFATALLAASLINEQWERSVRSDLIRDRFEVEALLKLDARSRLDAIAPIAANSDVRSALRRASARRDGQDIDEEISEPLQRKLNELNGQLAGMRGDLLFAVDAQGWVVAAVAPGNMPDGAGIGQFPLVRRALDGYVRDDVWVYNDNVYRMAARPVVEGGQYVGALVHGKRFDDELAELLSTRLDGASVAFFRGSEMFAGYMPSGVQGAPRRDDMGGETLAGVLENEALESGDRTDPMPLGTGGLAVYSLTTGSARYANVGYAVARPMRTLAQPLEILDHVSGDAWAGLPWIPMAGGGLFAFLIAMFLIWLERDRPLSKLNKHAAALSASPENRLTITDFGGRYRKIANNVNEALDKVNEAGGGAGPRRKAANLDQILGPAQGEEGAAASGSFFGFAQNGEAPAPDFPDVPAASPGAPAGMLGAPPPPAKPAPPKPPAGGPGRPPPKPPAPPRPPSAPKPPAASPAVEEEDDATRIESSPASSRKALKSTLLGVAPPSLDDDDDDDEGATMVARVPKELLEKSAGGGEDEQSHFREVFDQFVAMKKKCGEPTAGLTFDKFAVTLRKNRDQIVSRHAASRVRFTVYEKNGKAALKATPIKE